MTEWDKLWEEVDWRNILETPIAWLDEIKAEGDKLQKNAMSDEDAETITNQRREIFELEQKLEAIRGHANNLNLSRRERIEKIREVLGE